MKFGIDKKELTPTLTKGITLFICNDYSLCVAAHGITKNQDTLLSEP